LIGVTRFFHRTVGAKLNNRIQPRIYFLDPFDVSANQLLA
jgi:hypothetical protein